MLSEKEFESVIKLIPFERYKYFIKRVADSEKLFSLKRDKEWAIAEVENFKLISFWSSKEFAQKESIESWKNFSVVEISLESFELEVTPIIMENDYLLNIFSVNGKTGFVVNLEEFLKDLNAELEKYK